MATEREELVTFNVGGEHFQVLEHIIRAKGDTLLSTLLDDPARANSATKDAAIYVNGNPKLFPLIWDWFRFGGCILIPVSVSLPQMRRECAFYQLPDDVSIKREKVGELMAELTEERSQSLKRATENVEKKQQAFQAAGLELAAAKVYEDMLKIICENDKWETTTSVEGLPGSMSTIYAEVSNQVVRCTNPSCGGNYYVHQWHQNSRRCPSCKQRYNGDGTTYEWFKSEPEGDIKTVMARVSELAVADGWEFTATPAAPPTGTLKLPKPQAESQSVLLRQA